LLRRGFRRVGTEIRVGVFGEFRIPLHLGHF
jgi:hypothetical protein